MTQEERIVIAERIAIALEWQNANPRGGVQLERIARGLECLVKQQERSLDSFERIAMALDRANLIAEYFLNDYQQSRGGTHDRE